MAKKRSLAGFDDVADNNNNTNKNDIEIVSKSNSKDASINDSKDESATKSTNNIDSLLKQRKKSEKKHYVGFYATGDVKEFLDQVPSGNKSAIINEALKLVIQSKGL